MGGGGGGDEEEDVAVAQTPVAPALQVIVLVSLHSFPSPSGLAADIARWIADFVASHTVSCADSVCIWAKVRSVICDRSVG
jgi:hypothetical protein